MSAYSQNMEKPKNVIYLLMELIFLLDRLYQWCECLLLVTIYSWQPHIRSEFHVLNSNS